MAAQPAEHDYPLDPQQIIDDLPAADRGFFLAEYRVAIDEARDPAGFAGLARLLKLWRHHADTAREPGYAAARDAAGRPAREGMLLEDAVRRYRAAS